MADSGNGERRRDHREGRNGEPDNSRRRDQREDRGRDRTRGSARRGQQSEDRNDERTRSRQRRQDSDRERTRVPADRGGEGSGRERERPDGTKVRDHRSDSNEGTRISWQPSVLAPVFFGTRDYDSRDAPGDIRMFFPSTDGTSTKARILPGAEPFPVILFLHGNCDEPEHYKKWHHLPKTLARCGYVVAVPDLPYTRQGGRPWEDSNPDEDLVIDIVEWLRSGWEHSDLISLRNTGLIGHSYGALLAARVSPPIRDRMIALRLPYISLSGVWLDWRDFPLETLRTESLFIWGTGSDLGDEIKAQLVRGSDGEDVHWHAVERPRRRIEIDEGLHWDYLPEGTVTCEQERGECDLTEQFTADFAALFFSRTMPPPKHDDMDQKIDHDLLPPELDLTEVQEFFIAGHMRGIEQLKESDTCSITHTWELEGDSSDSIEIPGSGGGWWPWNSDD